MKREQKIFLAVILLALAGWGIAAVMAMSLGAFKLRTTIAENDAAKFRRQAGKAYTEMLMTKRGSSDLSVLIPKGARIDCGMTNSVEGGRTVMKCVDGVIYPPSDY